MCGTDVCDSDVNLTEDVVLVYIAEIIITISVVSIIIVIVNLLISIIIALANILGAFVFAHKAPDECKNNWQAISGTLT